MAQGQIKKTTSLSKRRMSMGRQKSRPSTQGPKKGARTIAPKKASLVKQRKITKKLTSNLINKTERMLAERAGHLELLAGGEKKMKKEKQQQR